MHGCSKLSSVARDCCINTVEGAASASFQRSPAMSTVCLCRRHVHVLHLCFFTLLLAAASPRVVADGNVTLQSLTIYKTHEWFGLKPKVYFQCTSDAKVNLPDIKQKNQLYTFEGQESWQPITKLVGTKCRRCGLYEDDSLNPDDVYDRWELCPLDFTPSPEGRYFRFKEDEFNLTLSCPTCNATKEKINSTKSTS